MKNQSIHRVLTIIISSVWLVNGLICKVLNLVPRHQQIVTEILGQGHSSSPFSEWKEARRYDESTYFLYRSDCIPNWIAVFAFTRRFNKY